MKNGKKKRKERKRSTEGKKKKKKVIVASQGFVWLILFLPLLSFRLPCLVKSSKKRVRIMF